VQAAHECRWQAPFVEGRKRLPGGSFEARRSRVMRRSCRSWASSSKTSSSSGSAGSCSASTNRDTNSRAAVVRRKPVRRRVI
jgi:hypothetical protein